MREQKSEVRNAIVQTKKLDDATAAKLRAAIEEFQNQHAAAKQKAKKAG